MGTTVHCMFCLLVAASETGAACLADLTQVEGNKIKCAVCFWQQLAVILVCDDGYLAEKCAECRWLVCELESERCLRRQLMVPFHWPADYLPLHSTASMPCHRLLVHDATTSKTIVLCILPLFSSGLLCLVFWLARLPCCNDEML